MSKSQSIDFLLLDSRSRSLRIDPDLRVFSPCSSPVEDAVWRELLILILTLLNFLFLILILSINNVSVKTILNTKAEFVTVNIAEKNKSLLSPVLATLKPKNHKSFIRNPTEFIQKQPENKIDPFIFLTRRDFKKTTTTTTITRNFILWPFYRLSFFILCQKWSCWKVPALRPSIRHSWWRTGRPKSWAGNYFHWSTFLQFQILAFCIYVSDMFSTYRRWIEAILAFCHRDSLQLFITRDSSVIIKPDIFVSETQAWINDVEIELSPQVSGLIELSIVFLCLGQSEPPPEFQFYAY